MKHLSWSRRDCIKALMTLPLWQPVIGLAAPQPERIVAINWLAAETLLSLGKVPLAVSDSGYFRRRIATPYLPETVQDIGPFWEPNIELIAALKPSLILSDMLPPAILDSLRQVAPLEVVTVYPAAANSDIWQGLVQFTTALGLRLNEVAAAAHWVQQATTAIEQCRQQLAHLAPQRIGVMVLSQDGKYATVYGRNSLVDAVLTRLNLSNAWTQPVNLMGTANIGIEKLASLQADRLFYTELPTTMTQLSRARQPNRLWQQLPLVASGKVSQLAHFFPFGALATAVSLAQHISAELIGHDHHG